MGRIKNYLFSISEPTMFLSGISIGFININLDQIQNLGEFIVIPVITLFVSLWFRYLKFKQDSKHRNELNEIQLLEAKEKVKRLEQERMQDKEKHEIQMEELKIKIKNG